MRRSVEPDDDVEPIVDGWRLRRNQRDGHGGMSCAVRTDGADRQVDSGTPSPGPDHEQFRSRGSSDETRTGSAVDHPSDVDERRGMLHQERTKTPDCVIPIGPAALLALFERTEPKCVQTALEHHHRLDDTEMVGMIDRPLQGGHRAGRAVDADNHCSIFTRWLRHDSTLTDHDNADQGRSSLNGRQAVCPCPRRILGATIGS